MIKNNTNLKIKIIKQLLRSKLLLNKQLNSAQQLLEQQPTVLRVNYFCVL